MPLPPLMAERWVALSAVALASLFVVFAGCGSDAASPGPNGTSSSSSSGDAAPGNDATSSTDDGGNSNTDGEAGPHPAGDGGGGGIGNLRIVAGNLSSGQATTYDTGEGIRIFNGLHPDVAMVQELNYGTNSTADLTTFVTNAFGANYNYFRGTGQIPNAVVSRYPIASSGQWTDPAVDNRGFVWANITVPGSHPLWAVSVHLLTTGDADRGTEATALVGLLNGVVQPGDYIVIGGDFNTDNRTETCITTFAAILNTQGPYPADQAGNDNTSGPRSRPHDWVLASPTLVAHQVATVIGANSFPNGLVFDSRIYTPLSDVAPVMQSDSGSLNMQHMLVAKDFLVE